MGWTVLLALVSMSAFAADGRPARGAWFGERFVARRAFGVAEGTRPNALNVWVLDDLRRCEQVLQVWSGEGRPPRVDPIVALFWNDVTLDLTASEVHVWGDAGQVAVEGVATLDEVPLAGTEPSIFLHLSAGRQGRHDAGRPGDGVRGRVPLRLCHPLVTRWPHADDVFEPTSYWFQPPGGRPFALVSTAPTGWPMVGSYVWATEDSHAEFSVSGPHELPSELEAKLRTEIDADPRSELISWTELDADVRIVRWRVPNGAYARQYLRVIRVAGPLAGLTCGFSGNDWAADALLARAERACLAIRQVDPSQP